MSRTQGSFVGNNGVAGLKAFDKQVKKQKSQAVTSGARELRKAMRKVVGVRKGDSAPGDAPARDRGALYRSMQYARVNGVMRIGTGWFVGRLMQEGVYSPQVTVHARPWAEESIHMAARKMGLATTASMGSLVNTRQARQR